MRSSHQVVAVWRFSRFLRFDSWRSSLRFSSGRARNSAGGRLPGRRLAASGWWKKAGVFWRVVSGLKVRRVSTASSGERAAKRSRRAGEAPNPARWRRWAA